MGFWASRSPSAWPSSLRPGEEGQGSILEGKTGTTVGKLVDKGKGYIEVKADGEEKGEKYVPEWVGGNPDKGGGPDKAVLTVFDTLKVGSRIEVDWVFHERLRIKVKVLRAPE